MTPQQLLYLQQIQHHVLQLHGQQHAAQQQRAALLFVQQQQQQQQQAGAPGEQQRQGCGQQQGPHLQAGAEAAHPAQPARKPEHLQRLAAQAQAAEPPELASQPFASSDGDAFHSRYDAAVLAAERALQAGPEPGDAGRRAAAASRSLESRRSGELAGLQPGSHDTGPGLQLGAEQELQAWGLLPHSSGWPSNGLAWWHTMHMPSAWHLSGALDMASIAC